MLLPRTFGPSLPRDNPDERLNCSLATKTGFGCSYRELKLDSNIWCGSSISAFVNVPTLCFFDDLSPSELFIGEVSRQPESGVRGSCCEENDWSIERLLLRPCSCTDVSIWGDSDVGAGVPGSVRLSESRPLSPAAEGVTPESGTSERTPLSRCCSSIIFFKYFPCASILSCSCLWTCKGKKGSRWEQVTFKIPKN